MKSNTAGKEIMMNLCDPILVSEEQAADERESEYRRLIDAADALYGRIYRIRQACFVPTHIGLGTWGRHEPMSETQGSKVAELQRERNKLLGKARRLKARVGG